MPVTPRQLVGREEEFGAIVAALETGDQLPTTTVLTGDAGIGKTTLWLAGIDAATTRGYRVLSSRPSEAETRFSYAGLTDLLGDAAAEVSSQLPPVQRRALETALLLGDSDAPADDRAVAAAFLGAVRLLAGEAAVCLAVDDVQWLDAASLAALRYALARLGDEPIAALLAVRGDLPSWLRRAEPEGQVRVVPVEGLSLGALQELLRARLDASFPRPVLIRLWKTSGGNPFFALELAGALQRRGGVLAPGEELPMPSDLDELLRERIENLGAPALQAARVVAAVADPTVHLVEAVVGRPFDAALAETLAARVVELDRDRLRFTHPLLGTAVSARQTPAGRSSLHAQLAGIVTSAEERARHLALATAEPSGEIAAVLEDASRSARERGATAAAAELAEQALRLTPRADDEDARRRLLLAADRYHIAGDLARAVDLLADARAAAAPGTGRAEILVQLADVLARTEPRDADELYAEALANADGDIALEATIHLKHADLMSWGAGIERGVTRAELAVRAASRTDDTALRCRTLAVHGEWLFRSGRGVPRAQMEEALALERTLPGCPLVQGPTEYLCYQLAWSFDFDPALALLLELRERRQAQDDAGGEAWALWNLAFVEWRAGDWDEAERYAAELSELNRQLGGDSFAEEFPAAIIAAHRGRVDEARAMAERSIARGDAAGVAIERSGHSWILGLLALSLGDATLALGHLRTAHEVRDAFMLDPAQRLELGDLLEALIATGELDRAEHVLATWDARAGALDRAWALAILARGRGLLLAARGDLENAFASFETALAEHARAMDPFHHARTLLALGRTQRRAKRRRDARQTLTDALAGFERLGAPLWAEQTRAEIARIGGRAPSRDDLTEAEHRIATLVAEGHTNREVAAALFLTEHSVETALTRIYRKLGVRSRAELTRLLAANS